MIYVDSLMGHGWKLNGRTVESCHMFADDLEELHVMAEQIGLKRSWLHISSRGLEHYDLVKSKRDAAVKLGVVEMTMMEAVGKWKELRNE